MRGINNLKKTFNIVAVIVTYNRKELLCECISAIKSQSYSVKKIIIIDNNSTDKTFEKLNEEGFLNDEVISYKKLEKNVGGAGGFYEGIKFAMESEQSSDFMWIMDDDTIPYSNSLENLIKAYSNEKISYLASCVKGKNDEPMNVPFLDTSKEANGYPSWYFDLQDKKVSIKTATFVSILVNVEAIRAVGLPCRDFFIWGDDTEYTTRLTSVYGKAYLVGDSWVCHKRNNAQALSILNEDNRDRLDNYFYNYRNNMVVTGIYSGKKSMFIRAIKNVVYSFRLLTKKNGMKKFRIIIGGTVAGYRELNKFKNYIMNERIRYKHNVEN